ncbi:MAG: FmdB family zinc ribbon protein [Planctomycetota bacterium]|jgi:putative FmdB family regulatory protein
MPTYDYVCEACHCEFERFQKMTDGALRKCPHCGKLKLKRLMGTGAGVIFRGSGFYETDYKRKSPNGTGRRHTSTSAKPSESSSGDKEEKKKSDD